MKNRPDRVCVIGAGPSGITAAKNILDQGFTNLVIYDRGSEVGGNWVFDAESGHSSVFETTHIISSRDYSQYDDFPMPEDFPDYPGHKHLSQYFQDYARHFKLYDFIEFNTMVEHCEKLDDNTWQVTTQCKAQTKKETFDWLIVCNGHHWNPRYPQWPGMDTFTGNISHSHDFKRAEPYRDKRVLVIGGGNSACDVAVETGRVTEYTDVSMRRGYWIVPKLLFGIPADHIHNTIDKYFSWLPWKARRKGLELMIKLLNGKNSEYNMLEPDAPFGATHPTSNSELLYFIRHGDVGVQRDVSHIDGSTVHFVDGSSRDYDEIICCTGFKISHPFFDKDFIDYSEGMVPLYLKMLPAKHNNLSFIGLFQPLGCIWPASELQAKIFARKMAGEWQPPSNLEEAIQYEIEHPDVEQIKTARHTITVDYPVFRKKLLKELPKDFVSREPAPIPPKTQQTASLKEAS